MHTAADKIMLLDEVVSTAFASWQLYTAGEDKFSKWPKEWRSRPDYIGYTTLRVLLGNSLINACYTLVDSGKRSYSMHHAIKDPDLIVTPPANRECEKCLQLRSKIATYRNNITAHVNAKRTQADWGQFAGIKKEEIKSFVFSARNVVEALGKANLDLHFIPSSRMPFQENFREYCRSMIDHQN